jgi:phosphohistidine swiveling domain-containing protein
VTRVSGNFRRLTAAKGSQGLDGWSVERRRGTATRADQVAEPAEKVAKKITVTENGTKVTLYDLQGKAAAILAQANASTSTSAGSAT